MLVLHLPCIGPALEHALRLEGQQHSHALETLKEVPRALLNTHQGSLAADIQVMLPSTSVAVPFQHLAEKNCPAWPNICDITSQLLLTAPARAMRTQNALAPMWALSVGEGKQAGIKVLQTLYTECQALSSKSSKLHLLQRHGRLLHHHRKERSLKCILHLHSMLGRWRAPPPYLPLMSDRIHPEVRRSPQITTQSTATSRSGVHSLVAALRITPAQLGLLFPPV